MPTETLTNPESKMSLREKLIGPELPTSRTAVIAVPTGLSTGRTLPVFDIGGRRVPDGLHILAQCKKNPGSVLIDDSFAAAVTHYGTPHKAFYFAFGGCHGERPASIEIVDRTKILAWAKTERGTMYRRFLLGE
jgi:hypothetical protein